MRAIIPSVSGRNTGHSQSAQSFFVNQSVYQVVLILRRLQYWANDEYELTPLLKLIFFWWCDLYITSLIFSCPFIFSWWFLTDLNAGWQVALLETRATADYGDSNLLEWLWDKINGCYCILEMWILVEYFWLGRLLIISWQPQGIQLVKSYHTSYWQILSVGGPQGCAISF